MKTTIAVSLAAVGVCLAAASVRADVFNMPAGQTSLSFVTVGDPGNPADPNTGSAYGSVPYVCNIGQYDVTVGQYVQFLNAVAATDTFGLYNSNMATDFPTISVVRSGSPGSYTYSVGGSYGQAANCPVFDVTWGDAARFCNWLDNHQAAGPEGPGTTETGAYTLNGAVTQSQLMAITRNAGFEYFIPNENEWYKAAYYSGVGSNYYTYATSSNTTPGNTLSPLLPDQANYYNDGYTDPTNVLTPVGAFAASPSPWGTFDQSGDVYDWNETAVAGSSRGMRGGAFINNGAYHLSSSARYNGNPDR
jgi:formylglycine-generating enzyme required for sulfatase activity